MARDQNGRRNLMREQLAHAAARIMAEDGIEDFALAKRKAARQAGVPATRHLPTNDEVEEALRAYQDLYQNAEHRLRLLFLRQEALRWMREFTRFNPHLTGSVLSGRAGRYSDINLHLFTDSAKEVELCLIDRRIPYRQAEMRLFVADRARTLPSFVLTEAEVAVTLTVFESDDVRSSARRNPDGRPMERARLEGVSALLAEGEDTAAG